MYAIRSYYGIFPLGMHGRSLLVAVADPFNAQPLNDLSTLTGTLVTPQVATGDEILRITSYNVCYTKLLRLQVRLVIESGGPGQAGTRHQDKQD